MADPIYDLALVKKHLRVSSVTEDTLITLYADTAQQHIQDYIDGVIPGSSDDVGDPDADPVVPPLADKVPPTIIAAHLLIVGDLYENRGTKITGTTVAENSTLVRLLYPYRQQLGV